MEVDRSNLRGLDNRRRQDDEIENAEQVVGRDAAHPRGRVVPVPTRLNPYGVRPPQYCWVIGENTFDSQTPRSQDLSAFYEQVSLAHEHA